MTIHKKLLLQFRNDCQQLISNLKLKTFIKGKHHIQYSCGGVFPFVFEKKAIPEQL